MGIGRGNARDYVLCGGDDLYERKCGMIYDGWDWDMVQSGVGHSYM